LLTARQKLAAAPIAQVYSAAFCAGPEENIAMLTRLFWVLTVLICATTALAHEEEPEEDPGPWSGKVAVGYLATSGNTENSSLNTAFEVGYATGSWEHFLRGLAFNASEDNVTSSEYYELGWKSQWSLSEFDFLFGRLSWRTDRFSTYETQFSQTAGYGRRLINSERQILNVEVGAGARQSDLIDGSTESELIFRGGLDYQFNFNEDVKFTQLLSVEAGDENTYIESISAFTASLIGNLALVASYTVKHNSEVLPLTEKTDTYTALSLEYVF
jgi:putative salt-induced outer membrane protein